jgi:hypothetical protein
MANSCIPGVGETASQVPGNLTGPIQPLSKGRVSARGAPIALGTY